MIAARLLLLAVKYGMLALVVAFLFAAIGDIAYGRVPARAEPCRGCDPPARVAGYDLFYRALGQDHGHPPIVAVHGGPGHSSLSFKGSLDFLGQTRRLVLYDQRGSGLSEGKQDPRDYRIGALVEELEALRRDVLQADRIVVLGHSFGGAVAQRYAIAHPDRVAGLVLVGSVRADNGMASRLFWTWFGPALVSTALGLPPGDPTRADQWLARASEDGADRLFDPSRAEDVLGDTGPIRFVAWREASFSAAGYAYTGGLRQLPMPTLVIYGQADQEWTGRPVAEEICRLVPDCAVERFAESGHWPFLEEPGRFREVVLSFLEGVR